MSHIPRAQYEQGEALVRMTAAGRQVGRLLGWTGDYAELFIDVGRNGPRRKWFSAHEWLKPEPAREVS